MFHESVFTRPHAACRRPELWYAHDSDSSEVEVSELVGALVRALQPELVVETGTAFGHTTVQIGLALGRNGHGRCVSLEVDHERACVARELLLSEGVMSVEVREQSSLDYEPEGELGFAWFDSLYELRAAEFCRYRDAGHLKPGTIVGFHDWTSGLRGHYLDVRTVVRRLASAGLLQPIFLPTPRGVVLAEVL